MRYIVRKSYVDVIGEIWMPRVVCAQRKDLSSYDVANIKAYDEEGQVTRESVEQWLAVNSGDFSCVKDFSASVEDGDQTIDISWAEEESECTFVDCMFPAED